ncbi:MAG: hypothetical protein WEA11_08570, partial [Acidimicrobiales bacterium]
MSVMIDAVVYNAESSWQVRGLEAITSAIADPSNLVWVDLREPSESELDEVAEHLQLHELAVEDVRK